MASSSTFSIGPGEVAAMFGRQYYAQLFASPEDLVKFYNGDSQFSFGVPSDSASQSVSGLDAIGNAIASLNLKGSMTQIKHIDCQESRGGYLMLISGQFTSPAETVRNFSHVVFLAPNGPGFFVLNHIFRYTDNETNQFIQERQPEVVHSQKVFSESVPVQPVAAEVSKVSANQEFAAPAPTRNHAAVVEKEANPAEVKASVPKSWAAITRSAPFPNRPTWAAESSPAASPKVDAHPRTESKLVKQARPTGQRATSTTAPRTVDNRTFEVRVSDIPASVDKDELMAFFTEKLPSQHTIRSVKKLPQCAYVVFDKAVSVDYVLSNQSWIINDKKLTVEKSAPSQGRPRPQFPRNA